MTEVLQDNAGKDSYQDAKFSGYIQAVKDLLLVEYGDVEETK